MALIEWYLRTTDLPATCQRLRVRLDLASAAPPAAATTRFPRTACRAVLASLLVTSRWPAGNTCLRRCLLLGYRLRRLEPVLRVGVRRDATGAFAAHSWLEIDGATLDPTAAEFATLGSPERAG